MLMQWRAQTTVLGRSFVQDQSVLVIFCSFVVRIAKKDRRHVLKKCTSIWAGCRIGLWPCWTFRLSWKRWKALCFTALNMWRFVGKPVKSLKIERSTSSHQCMNSSVWLYSCQWHGRQCLNSSLSLLILGMRKLLIFEDRFPFGVIVSKFLFIFLHSVLKSCLRLLDLSFWAYLQLWGRFEIVANYFTQLPFGHEVCWSWNPNLLEALLDALIRLWSTGD